MKNVEDVYPLSPLQESLLLSVLSAPGSSVGFEQSSWVIEAPLDETAFRRTWERALERHPILRTAFFVDAGKKPLQVVRQKVDLPFDLQDWRGLDPEEQQRKLDKYLEDDRRRGFDLTRAPLMRVGLIRLADARYCLAWSNQHLLLDGWCVPLVLREVLALYGRFSQGQRDDLPCPRPFRDYIVWLQKQNLTEAERYWRTALAGFSRPTPLRFGQAGADREPGERSYPFHEIRLAAGEADILRRFCREQEITLGSLVQAAWALLLARTSGTDDVVFGSVVSGRPADLPGAEAMIGLFINNLPVRVRVDEDASLFPWLRVVQANVAEMRRWEHMPLSKVQEWSEVSWGRRLFETLVVVQNYASDESPDEALAGLGIGPQRYRFETSYPLALEVTPRSWLGLRLYYDAGALSTVTARRLLGHFETILRGLAAAPPSATLGSVPWLTPPELHAVLHEWSEEAAASAGFPGRRVFLLGPGRQPVPAGLTADLWVEGEEGWGPTGQRARFRDSGALEPRGSADSPAVAGEEWLRLDEIEAELRDCPDLLQAAVVECESVEDPRIALCAVADPAAHPPVSTEAVRRFLRRRLPRRAVPEEIVLLPELPRKPYGDVDRAALVARLVSGAGFEGFNRPRNATELQLVQIWEELFEIRPIAVTDNFFGLGGHSLLAVRLVAEIKERFGHALPLSSLLGASSIAELAALLDSGGTAGAGTSLVSIQPAGARAPLFWVHPSGGNVLCYVPAIYELGRERPSFGLRARGVQDGEEPLANVEEIALRYLAEIPGNPRVLMGWSFGGLVALEMARQLRERGESIELLAILDTWVGERESQDLDDAALLAELLSQELPCTAEELRSQESLPAQIDYLLERGRERGLPSSLFLDRATALRVFKIHRAARIAADGYTPQPYPGRVALFRAIERPDPRVREIVQRDPSLGWEGLGAQVRIYEVPGNHENLCEARHARALAEQIRHALRDAGL